MKTVFTILVLFFVGISLFAEEPMLEATPFSQVKIGNGKAVMLEFGSASCRSCIEMDKILYKLKNKYKNANIYFINIYKDMKSARKFKVRMIPTQIFIDEKGNYIGSHIGAIKQDRLVENLKRLKIL